MSIDLIFQKEFSHRDAIGVELVLILHWSPLSICYKRAIFSLITMAPSFRVEALALA